MQTQAEMHSITNNNTAIDHLSTLVTRWQRLDKLRSEIEKDLPTVSTGDLPPQAQVKLAKIEHNVELEQRQILEQALEIPANCLPEILSKLTIWKLIVCPSEAEKDFLQPTDKLIYSVIDDLIAMPCSR